MMKTQIFQGKDTIDLQQQLWAWRSANPTVVVRKEHPSERLPLQMQRPAGRFTKMMAPNLVSMRIDYED
jgi:hypothetical protein